MRWNWITILIAILLISFVVYLYTAKLPVEDYMNQYGKNELAHAIKVDGQMQRGLWNYFNETYYDLRGFHMVFGNNIISGKTSFLNDIQSTCEAMIQNIKDRIEDNDYETEKEAFEDKS